MSLHRKEKLAELYKRAAGAFLATRVKVEDSIFSVTMTELTDKLDRLKIYFAVWPDDKERDVLKSLEKTRGELRKHLAEEIRTKFVPEIEFIVDDSEKKRLRFEELLNKEG